MGDDHQKECLETHTAVFWATKSKSAFLIRYCCSIYFEVWQNTKAWDEILDWQNSVPLVIKEPVRLRAEQPLEVESQRRSGSDSSTKKHLFFSKGDGSTGIMAASGFGAGLGLRGAGFAGRDDLSTSSWKTRTQNASDMRSQQYCISAVQEEPSANPLLGELKTTHLQRIIRH